MSFVIPCRRENCPYHNQNRINGASPTFFTPRQIPVDDVNDVASSSNVTQSKHNHISVDLTIEQVQNEHGIIRALFLLLDFDFKILGTTIDSHSDSDDDESDEGNADGTDGKGEWILN